MGVERTEEFLLMWFAKLAFVGIFEAVTTEKLFFLNTVPICIRIQTLLAFLFLGVPAFNFRSRLIGIYVSVLDIKLPTVLGG